MSASDFARMKELERRIGQLEQEVAQLKSAAQESAKPLAPVGQKPPLSLKKAN